MISVSQALDHLFALTPVLPPEPVTLLQASGRVLSTDAVAKRAQPPFSASAMDGYALRNDEAAPGATFQVIGEAAAGHAFHSEIGPGQCVRIFTGAPVPNGADRVIIQEDVERDGDIITLQSDLDASTYIREIGQDFKSGDRIAAPRKLNASDIALLAAMNVAEVEVTRKPIVAIMPTGDELVQPGEDPSDDQIIASNSYGLATLLEGHGADVRLLPIARDTLESLKLNFKLAKGADLIITIGGASVGDHDLVADAAAEAGMERSFYKVAMRPGKPLMAGRMDDAMLIGLPGNPVSAMVCGHIFVLPVLQKMLGLGAQPASTELAPLAHDIPANGPREHYMRAELVDGKISIKQRQDSALLSVLSKANCLAIRPPHDPARSAGHNLQIVKL